MPSKKREGHAPEPIQNLRATKSYTSRDVDRKWVLVDAKGQHVGRLATRIADVLRGKHKPTFTPHDDVGDFVVVINAGELVLHNKRDKKIYYKHTSYLGHMKKRTGGQMLDENPELTLELAVWGMISGEALKHHMMRKLKVYRGPEHPHKAQRPELLRLPGTNERAA